MADTPTITWSKIDGVIRSMSDDEIVSRGEACVLVGPCIYIFSKHASPTASSHVYTINLSTQRWDRLPVPLNYPRHFGGHRTVLLGDDRVMFLGSDYAEVDRGRDEIALFDLPLNEYVYKPLDYMSFDCEFMELSSGVVADYWESRSVVLVNERGSWYYREATHTYMIDTVSWTVKRIDASGYPPSYRYDHSSLLVDSKAGSKWFIVGGASPAHAISYEYDDLSFMYILDLHAKGKPAWSSIGPQEIFGDLVRVSMVFWKNKVVVLGGGFGRSYSDTVGYVDIANESWTSTSEEIVGDVPQEAVLTTGTMLATGAGALMVPKPMDFMGAIYRVDIS